MSEATLHTEEFDVKRIDGNVLSGDSNKIKLKIISYAAILEVQEAYMKEEIVAKEKEKKELEQKLESEELSRKEKREIKKGLSLLNTDLEILNEVFLEFSESRKKFMEIAKKALKLPEENLKQLAENGWIEIEDTAKNKEIINLEAFNSAEKNLIDAQNDDIFSNIDTETIKEEVNRAMIEKEDINDINFENFDTEISKISKETKENVDNIISERIDDDTAMNILNSEETKFEQEKNQKNESPTVEFNVPSIAGETGEWAPVQQPTNNKSFTGFDGDTSIADYISKLEEETQEIKASREKTKDEKEQALQKTTEAEQARDEAKAKSEKTRNDVEEFKKYMPRIKEAQEAKRKEEEALKTEMAELASINLKKTALETETAEYDEETRKYLEELREMKAILNGEEPEPKKEDLPKNVIK